MNYKTILLIISLSVLFNTANSQQEEIPEYDTSYIESYRDYMVITLVSIWNSSSVYITDNNGKTIDFTTDRPWDFGFAFDYKWLTFEYSNNINRNYHKTANVNTKARSFGFGLTGRKFWFRNFWKKYKGYYMANPYYNDEPFDPTVDNYPQRNDLSTSIYFANLNYGFNYKRYSNMASMWQLEKQKKSAGSFTAGLSYANIRYKADSTLVLKKWRDNFEDDALIKSYSLNLIGLNAGYLHTFAMFKRKRLFLSGALIPGLSYQWAKAKLENNLPEVNKEMIGFQTNIRIVLGYNCNRWYTSLSGNLYVITNNISENSSISQDYTFIRFMVGYKFKVKNSSVPFFSKIGL